MRTDWAELSSGIIRHELRRMWPDVRGQRVLGIGFPTPYLGIFREEGRAGYRCDASGVRGVMHWPVGERGLTMLNDDADLPLPDLSVDRVLLIPCLGMFRASAPNVTRSMARVG